METAEIRSPYLAWKLLIQSLSEAAASASTHGIGGELRKAATSGEITKEEQAELWLMLLGASQP